MTKNDHQLNEEIILEIIYETNDLIAINKPHGLLVHKSKIAKDAHEFALQMLRNQVGYKVFPAHRLDRKTSGVLLFSKSKEIDSLIQKLFRDRKVDKKYHAIVRGFTPLSGIVDYAIGENERKQEALTRYSTLKHFELEIESGKFQTSRYSLVELLPETGRYHQLRKHLAHILHPIIGDRPHGCNKQNKIWKDKFNMTTMMLHARSLTFEFPEGKINHIIAESSTIFQNVLQKLERENTFAREKTNSAD